MLSKRQISLGITVMCLVWGSTFLAVKVNLQNLPPFTAAGMRFVVAVAVLGAIMMWRKERVPWTLAAQKQLALIGFLSFVLSYGSVYWGQRFIPSGLMAVIFATFPFFVALFAHFLLPDDKLSLPKVAGILLGFLGTVVLFWEGALQTDPKFLAGMAVGLISPLSASLSTVLSKRHIKSIGTWPMTTIPMAYGALILLPLGASQGEWTQINWTPLGIGSLLYLAVFGSALTFTLYFRLLEEVPVTRLAMIAYITPVVALFLGWMILDETLSMRVIFGTAIILFGIKIARK